MRGLTVRCARETSIPVHERIANVGARRLQLFDLTVHFAEDAFRGGPNFAARRMSGIARLNEAGDLLEREPEAQRIAHELHARHGLL